MWRQSIACHCNFKMQKDSLQTTKAAGVGERSALNIRGTEKNKTPTPPPHKLTQIEMNGIGCSVTIAIHSDSMERKREKSCGAAELNYFPKWLKS